ncbi:MAG: isoprenylcysteine carboxylmethyltransferase family protein [Deltaproteobacteria bacterium]|nr:MAG: isoprenylcysteine carboxylmethyltransferase family protein [Deltaproteobacteria bacterium]
MTPALAAKILVFTVVVPGTVTVLIPYWILSASGGLAVPPLGVRPVIGLVVGALGAFVYGWCAWDFGSAGRGTPAPIDPPQALVVRGLYRYTRNPMYVGVLSLLLGEALFFSSRWLLLQAVILFGLFHSFVLLYEEPTLRRTFGTAYTRYCASVPRWIWKTSRRRAA